MWCLVSSADRVAEALRDVPNMALLMGTFVAESGVQAVVDVGVSRVTVPTLGYYFPVPGDTVRLLRLDKTLLMLGPANPRSPVGRVTATGSPRCTVECPSGSGVTKLMGYPSNITPAVNDVVLIDWTSGGTVIDKITASPTSVAPADPSSDTGGTFTQTFTALDSGTFYVPGARWNTADVWAVTTGNNRGAWFYGSKVQDTIPDAAVVSSVEIYAPVFYDGGAAPVAQVHTSASKPAGNVSLTSLTHTMSPRGGWVSLPTAFIDYMKVSGGGIALVDGGWAKYSSVASDGASGALRVTWTA